jgi:hypothetical protein
MPPAKITTKTIPKTATKTISKTTAKSSSRSSTSSQSSSQTKSLQTQIANISKSIASLSLKSGNPIGSKMMSSLKHK